jgi:error-prone DNA polymerase
MLPDMPIGEHVATDYQTMRLSLKAHPMAILRATFARERVTTCAGLATLRDGAFARTAGLVLVRQRPGKGNAIFITLEDETGVANLLLWSRQLPPFRRAVMTARLMLAEGRVQKSPEGVAHLMASGIYDYTERLDHLWETQRTGPTPAPPARHLAPPPRLRHPRDARILPKSRDFH